MNRKKNTLFFYLLFHIVIKYAPFFCFGTPIALTNHSPRFQGKIQAADQPVKSHGRQGKTPRLFFITKSFC